ncbi:unnamed protein product [Parajaminaea phylloscopi]
MADMRTTHVLAEEATRVPPTAHDTVLSKHQTQGLTRQDSDKGSKTSDIPEGPTVGPYLTQPSSDLSDADRALERALLRKTDLALLPLMGVIVLLQYLDKAILSYAALLGMTLQLRLVSNEYSWAASIYFFGFIAGLPLWCLALQKITTDRVVGVAVFVWGIICCCHSTVKGYGGLLAVRFFLGFFEAAITPAFIIIVGAFYTKREVPLRTAIWYSFNGLALILGGCMSWSLLKHHSLKSGTLPVWKELYLILGAVTIFFGIVTFALMPSTPALTRLYNEEERRVALIRTSTRAKSNVKAMFKSETFKRHFSESLRDLRLYIIFLGLTAGSIPIGGVTAYSLQLLNGFGFPVAESLLLTLAPGGAQIVAVALFVALTMLSRSRAVGAMTVLIPAIAGAAVMYAHGTDRVSKAAGYTLLNMGAPAITAIYSLTSSAVSGHGKKVIFATVGQVAFAAGNIIGPLTFLSREAPTYHTAKAIIIGCLCAAFVALCSIISVHFLWNRRRSRAGSSSTGQEAGRQSHRESYDEFVVTDFENPHYRYVY